MALLIYTVVQTDEDGLDTSWSHAYRSMEAAQKAVEADEAELREQIGIEEGELPPCQWLDAEGTFVYLVLGDENWQRWSVQETELQD